MPSTWRARPNDFEPRVGKRFTFFPDCPTSWKGNVDCEVLELVPERRMVWSWRTSGMEQPTRVVFELSASGSGCGSPEHTPRLRSG